MDFSQFGAKDLGLTFPSDEKFNAQLMTLIWNLIKNDGKDELAHSLEKAYKFFFDKEYFLNCVRRGRYMDAESYASSFLHLGQSVPSTVTIGLLRMHEFIEAVYDNKTDYARSFCRDSLCPVDVHWASKVSPSQLSELISARPSVRVEILTDYNLSYSSDNSHRDRLADSLRKALEINSVLKDVLQTPKAPHQSLVTLVKMGFAYQHSLCDAPEASPTISSILEDHKCKALTSPQPSAAAASAPVSEFTDFMATIGVGAQTAGSKRGPPSPIREGKKQRTFEEAPAPKTPADDSKRIAEEQRQREAELARQKAAEAEAAKAKAAAAAEAERQEKARKEREAAQQREREKAAAEAERQEKARAQKQEEERLRKEKEEAERKRKEKEAEEKERLRKEAEEKRRAEQAAADEKKKREDAENRRKMEEDRLKRQQEAEQKREEELRLKKQKEEQEAAAQKRAAAEAAEAERKRRQSGITASKAAAVEVEDDVMEVSPTTTAPKSYRVIRDIPSIKLTHSPHGHGPLEIVATEVHPTNPHIIMTASSAGHLFLWRLAPTPRLNFLNFKTNIKGRLLRAAWLPDGSKIVIVTGLPEPSLRVYSFIDERLALDSVISIPASFSTVSDFRVSPVELGSRVAIAAEGHVIACDLTTSSCLAEKIAPEVKSCAWMPTSRGPASLLLGLNSERKVGQVAVVNCAAPKLIPENMLYRSTAECVGVAVVEDRVFVLHPSELVQLNPKMNDVVERYEALAGAGISLSAAQGMLAVTDAPSDVKFFKPSSRAKLPTVIHWEVPVRDGRLMECKCKDGFVALFLSTPRAQPQAVLQMDEETAARISLHGSAVLSTSGSVVEEPVHVPPVPQASLIGIHTNFKSPTIQCQFFTTGKGFLALSGKGQLRMWIQSNEASATTYALGDDQTRRYTFEKAATPSAAGVAHAPSDIICEFPAPDLPGVRPCFAITKTDIFTITGKTNGFGLFRRKSKQAPQFWNLKIKNVDEASADPQTYVTSIAINASDFNRVIIGLANGEITAHNIGARMNNLFSIPPSPGPSSPVVSLAHYLDFEEKEKEKIGKHEFLASLTATRYLVTYEITPPNSTASQRATPVLRKQLDPECEGGKFLHWAHNTKEVLIVGERQVCSFTIDTAGVTGVTVLQTFPPNQTIKAACHEAEDRIVLAFADGTLQRFQLSPDRRQLIAGDVYSLPETFPECMNPGVEGGSVSLVSKTPHAETAPSSRVAVTSIHRNQTREREFIIGFENGAMAIANLPKAESSS